MNTTTQTQDDPETIDIRPNWQGLCRLYVLAARSGDKHFCSQPDAYQTVMRAARIADAMAELNARNLLSAEAKNLVIAICAD